MTSDAMGMIYNMNEAAAQLRKSRRWLQGWLANHPVDQFGQPFYSPFGRTKTFDDSDLARIRKAAREDERCRLSSFHRTQPPSHQLLGTRALPRRRR
jgi:hypothetical protein